MSSTCAQQPQKFEGNLLHPAEPEFLLLQSHIVGLEPLQVDKVLIMITTGTMGWVQYIHCAADLITGNFQLCADYAG